MELDDALLLLADAPAEDVVRRLSRVPADATVVVRRELDGRVLHYVVSAEAVSGAARRHPERPLGEALGLHEGDGVRSVGLAEAAEADLGQPVVVVQGDRLLGVLRPEPVDRGGGLRGGAVEDPGLVDEWSRGGGPVGGGRPGSCRGGWWWPRAGPARRRGAGALGDTDGEGARGVAPPGGGISRAFPRLAAPESVRSGVDFELVVRLSATDATASAPPLHCASSPARRGWTGYWVTG